MKILIRDPSKCCYLDTCDTWVDDIEKARDFGNGYDAVAYANGLGLMGIDLYYVFPNPQYNFATPLSAYL